MQLIYTIILSLVIIYLADQIIRYIKDTYTTKKTKDILGQHVQKYQSLIQEFQENNNHQIDELREKIEKDQGTKLTNLDLLSMNEELNALVENT